MKKWHLKKWVQHIVEVITASCIVILMGISEVNNLMGYLIMAGMAIMGTIGAFILSEYGRYK